MTGQAWRGSVALVLASATGGIGKHVASLAAGLTTVGCRVLVCGPAATEEQFGFTAAGADFVPVEIPAAPGPQDSGSVRALRRAIAGRELDVLHAHGLRAGLVAVLARPGVPVVVTWHNAVLAKGLRGFEARDPARAAKVQTIFVSVDPDRDTPPVLKQYVAAFHPRLIGLTGTRDQIAAVTKEYGVTYDRQPPVKGASGYLVQHSSMAVLYGPDGRPIAMVPVDATADAVAATLAEWVR